MENKKWYQQTIWIVILLVLFFPGGLFLMWKYSGWKPVIKWVVSGLFALLILANLSGGKNKETLQSSPTPTQVVQSTFEIPSLVGKNIDGIRTILGQPTDITQIEPNQTQLDLGVTEWNNSFKKDDKELLVTYNVKTRKVVDFFIGTNDASGQTKDKQQLLKENNLKENDPRYKIEFVKVINNPTYFTGVKIIPSASK